MSLLQFQSKTSFHSSFILSIFVPLHSISEKLAVFIVFMYLLMWSNPLCINNLFLFCHHFPCFDALWLNIGSIWALPLHVSTSSPCSGLTPYSRPPLCMGALLVLPGFSIPLWASVPYSALTLNIFKTELPGKEGKGGGKEKQIFSKDQKEIRKLAIWCLPKSISDKE